MFLTGDSLVILKLGTNDVTFITGIIPNSLKRPKDDQGSILAFQLKNSNKELILLNMLTMEQQRFEHVIDFLINDIGTTLLLKTDDSENNNKDESLKLVDIASKKVNEVWKSLHSNETLNGFAVDKSGQQVAFVIEQTNGNNKETSLWYWKQDMDKPIMKVNRHTIGIAPILQILPDLSFSENGKFIWFSLQSIFPVKPLQDPISVDVWSTSDTVLQSIQLQNPFPRPFAGVVNLAENKVNQVTSAWDNSYASMQTGNQDYVVVTHNCKGDRFWLNQPDSNWLISLKNGSRTLLATKGESQFWFSPGGKYLLYYDRGRGGHYFSYDLKTGKEIKISSNIPDRFFAFEPEGYDSTYYKFAPPVGLGGFSNDEKEVFVYDNYDIWKLNLSGAMMPVNITNGFGRQRHIKFRILSENKDLYNPPAIEIYRSQILTAFDTKTKFNGFYQKILSVKGEPEVLFMGPYFIYSGMHIQIGNSEFSSNFKPIKSVSTDRWIIKRESTSEAPNYFLTTDFKTYKALTYLQPQKEYNWPTAELVHFTRVDGVESQGILYKPKNFDSSKKYPVIFNIYQTLSQRLYQFPQPNFIQDAHINIPWFTSRGYLVFTPDVYRTAGQSGRSSLLSVESAVKELSKRFYIDSNRLGLTGHSLAGGSVAYIVSHSNLFSAAFEGAGNTDYVSSTLEISFDGPSRLFPNEQSMGANLWERRDLYLDNAVMHADKINTPLLIFHCKGDGGVLFEQGLELYLSLRRLEKTAWMLQYDYGTHDVNLKEAEDLSIRVTQFFDHYLKNTPAPKWMTQGIPARLKGIDYGYTLENEK
jgi:dienelactone hydrolase